MISKEEFKKTIKIRGEYFCEDLMNLQYDIHEQIQTAGTLEQNVQHNAPLFTTQAISKNFLLGLLVSTKKFEEKHVNALIDPDFPKKIKVFAKNKVNYFLVCYYRKKSDKDSIDLEKLMDKYTSNKHCFDKSDYAKEHDLPPIPVALMLPEEEMKETMKRAEGLSMPSFEDFIRRSRRNTDDD